MDRDLLGHLPIIACVARHRSFTAAAAELGMSPSAISHAVRSVEESIEQARQDPTACTALLDARFLEELTLNAWPPLETLLFDGWLLSFSDGYTRRANSIHPLYLSHLPLQAKIAACEAIYAARGLARVFKLLGEQPDAATWPVAVLDGLGQGLQNGQRSLRKLWEQPPPALAEAVRGVLFAIALLPALSVLRGRSWWTLVYLTLIGVVIEAWVPLLGRTTWPLAMRLGNVAELTADAFARAAVTMALLGSPPLVAISA